MAQMGVIVWMSFGLNGSMERVAALRSQLPGWEKGFASLHTRGMGPQKIPHIVV